MIVTLSAWERGIRGRRKRVFATKTAERARELARSEQPDLAAVDMLLGHDSGLELVEQLHEDGSGAFIVLISAVATADDWTAAQDAGVDLAIRKPVEIGALLDRVERGARLPKVESSRVASAKLVKWEHLMHVYNAVGNMTRAAELLGMRRQAAAAQEAATPLGRRPSIHRHDRHAVRAQHVQRLDGPVRLPDQVVVAVEVLLVDHDRELAAIDPDLLPSRVRKRAR